MSRFVAIFLVSALVLFLIYWVSDTTGHFDVVNRLNAMLSGGILGLIGLENTRFGTLVQFRAGGMEVISECSGVYVAILFAAGVLAFPAAWRAKLKGVVLGVLVIFAINVLRLVTLGAIIARKREWLPLFHEYLWQVLFILVVAGLYLLWIERMVPRERLDPAT
jgi:exosortase H (IPTLxxWG-CTERM-specific)